MLKMTNVSVIEITERLGFSTQQTFTRTFKQHFGLAPGRYRVLPVWYFKGLMPKLTEEVPILPVPERINRNLHSFKGISLSYTCNSSEIDSVSYHNEKRKELFYQASKLLNGKSPVSLAESCEPTAENADQIRFTLTFNTRFPESEPGTNGSLTFLRFPFRGSSAQLMEMQLNIYRHVMPFRKEARRSGQDFFICESEAEHLESVSGFRGCYYVPIVDGGETRFVK